MREVLEIVARYVGKTSATYRYIAADLAALSRPEPDWEAALERATDRIVAGRDGVRVSEAVEVRPVVVKDEPDAHQVWLCVGCQHFQVGLHLETKDEAEWFAQMLRTALAALCTNNQEIAR